MGHRHFPVSREELIGNGENVDVEKMLIFSGPHRHFPVSREELIGSGETVDVEKMSIFSRPQALPDYQRRVDRKWVDC